MAAAASGAPAPGTVLDGFRIEERLHQGGMATVWRASRADLPFPVALKVPRAGNHDDPAAIVGFETELAVLPKLAGRHVPRFIAAADFDVQPYLAMEFIPGPTLEEQRTAVPLPLGEVAAVGARIADALHELHRQGVIHLDLSPDNVMFRPGGEAVLLDFGLSRHVRLPDLLGEAFRRPLGTAAWMAPEQVLGVRDDLRSDLFALGAILYALATGRTPFGAPESPRGLRRRLSRDPPPPAPSPRTARPGCRRSCSAVLRSIPRVATRPRRSSPSTCATPTSLSLPSGQRAAGGAGSWPGPCGGSAVR
jgi:serine/threonine protein kinase